MQQCFHYYHRIRPYCIPREVDAPKDGLSLSNSLLPNLEPPLLLLENRLLVYCDDSCSLSLLDLSSENAATMMAIRNIRPKIQNATAILSGDTQKVRSPGMLVNGKVSGSETLKIFNKAALHVGATLKYIFLNYKTLIDAWCKCSLNNFVC